MRTYSMLCALAALTTACSGGSDSDSGTDTDTDGVEDKWPGPEPDGGCAKVDGEGGWDAVSDAMLNVSDGSVLDVTACDSIDDSLQFDMSVTLLGSDTPWTPPNDQSAATIAPGAVVVIEGVLAGAIEPVFDVQGTLTLRDSTLAPFGWGMTVSGTATLERVDLANDEDGGMSFGGVQVRGGTLHMSESTITGANSFGVQVIDGGTATLVGNAISATAFVNNQGFLFEADGVGVMGDDATLVLEGNTFTNNEVANVQLQTGSLSLNGDILQGGFVGLLVDDAELSVTNVSSTDYVAFGMRLTSLGEQETLLEDVTVTTLPELNPNTDTALGSWGIYALDSVLSITGTDEPSVVSGNNASGIFVGTSLTTDVAGLTLTNALVDNNQRFGVAVSNGSHFDLVDVDVTNSRAHPPTCMTDTGKSCDMAVASWLTPFTWTGGSLLDSEDWGLLVLETTGQVDGVTFSRNSENGLFAQAAAVTLNDVDFAEGGHYGLYSYSSQIEVTGDSVFRDADYTIVSESTYTDKDGNEVQRVRYNKYYAYDAYIYDSTVNFDGTRFENGNYGILGYAGTGTTDVTIRDATFTGLNRDAINASTGSTFTVQRTVFQDLGTNAFQCYSATLDVDNVVIDTVTTSTYEIETYDDGVLVPYPYSYTSESTGSAMSGNECSLDLTDTVVRDVNGYGLYMTNASTQMDGVDFVRVGKSYSSGNYALNYYHYGSDWDSDGNYDVAGYPDIYFTDVTITESDTVGGLSVRSWNDLFTGDRVNGTVELHNLKIGSSDGDGAKGPGGTAIYLDKLTDVSIYGLDIYGASGIGIDASLTDLLVDGTSGGVLSGTIDAPGSYGVRATGGALNLSNVQITSPSTSGIYLTEGEHALTGNTVTGAGTFGLQCATAFALNTCDSNSFEGTSGSVDGCTGC